MSDLPELHPLEVELDKRIFFRGKESRAVFLRVGLELMSQGYSVEATVALLTEIVQAVIEEASAIAAEEWSL